MTNFDKFRYVPIIHTRAAELLAFTNLKEQTRNKILPYICLSKFARLNTTELILEKLKSANSYPVIIGMSELRSNGLEDYPAITNEHNGFEKWRNLLAKAKETQQHIIPGLLYTSTAGKREFVKQVEFIQGHFGKYAYKFDPFDLRAKAAAMTVASIAKKIDEVLFIIDVGQITIHQQKLAIEATINALNEIRTIDRAFNIAVAGTSYPRSFAEYSQERFIPSLEWQNFLAMGGEDVAIYGDYASVSGEVYEGAFANFVARIDYPVLGGWIFERKKPSENEDRIDTYNQLAKQLISNQLWDSNLEAWGVDVINKAAEGSLEKFGSPAKWISVRVNTHMERILSFLDAPTQEDNDFDNIDDFEW